MDANRSCLYRYRRLANQADLKTEVQLLIITIITMALTQQPPWLFSLECDFKI
jgi:hypothetical protein